MLLLAFVLAIAILAGFLAFALVRATRATDEQVATFGTLIETSLRAQRVTGERAEWMLVDAERGFEARFRPYATYASVEFRPIGFDLTTLAATVPCAEWLANPDAPTGARFTREFESDAEPHTTWLVTQLEASVQRLGGLPVSSVSVFLPVLDVSVDSVQGSEPAREVARVFPHLRDLYAEVQAAAASGGGAQLRAAAGQ